VWCSYEDEALRNLHLTAYFSSESLEKTLSVISLSLKHGLKHECNREYWFSENHADEQTCRRAKRIISRINTKKEAINNHEKNISYVFK